MDDLTDAERDRLEDEWMEKYKPLTNEDGSQVFEYQDTLQYPITQVWSLIDGEDGHAWVVNGYHIVNKWGYTITEVPWDEADDLVQAPW